MNFEDSTHTEGTTHATLVFEREITAVAEKVFAAFEDANIRSQWSAPSETAVVIYDCEDFREGGEDIFLCGSKTDPNIHGRTRYLEIIPNRRVVSTESIAMGGRRLCVSLTTLELHASGKKTNLKSTVQIASFIGQDMIRGHKQGNNGSLNNLVQYLSRQHS